MPSKEQLIAGLDHAHEATLALLRALEAAHRDRQELYPTWTIKELLAHLTGWDDACIASLQAFIRGEVPLTPAARGIDPYNASTVLERQALSLSQVIQEWEATREVFKQLIRDVPESKLQDEFVFAWGEKGDLAALVDIFIEHEESHAQEIRQKVLSQ